MIDMKLLQLRGKLMRALLMTVVLLIAVVLIYEQVTGGDEGTHNQLKQSGEHISGSIRRMSP